MQAKEFNCNWGYMQLNSLRLSMLASSDRITYSQALITCQAVNSVALGVYAVEVSPVVNVCIQWQDNVFSGSHMHRIPTCNVNPTGLDVQHSQALIVRVHHRGKRHAHASGILNFPSRLHRHAAGRVSKISHHRHTEFTCTALHSDLHASKCFAAPYTHATALMQLAGKHKRRSQTESEISEGQIAPVVVQGFHGSSGNHIHLDRALRKW